MQEIIVLWICNKKPAKISLIKNQSIDSYGGWMDSTCDSITHIGFVRLCVLFPDIAEYEGAEGDFSFYSFREKKCYDRFLDVMKVVKPDIIHIWGTEFEHSNKALDVCEKLHLIDRCVISIQGLVSLYGKHHYTEGIPYKVVRRYTLRDIIKHENIAKGRDRFIQRGKFEIEAIKKSRHIIGRTDWDRAATQMFHPDAKYHFCNESLRDSFYKNVWNIEKMQRKSIFVSQCGYPIKGFHYLLRAMPEIIKRHPSAHIYTTGINLTHLSFKQRLHLSSYQLYLIELLEKYNLKDHITFLGNLSESEMCKQYLKANVFISASTIENSPNSVGEAMLVGCPVVASNVGGVNNMLNHKKDGFMYQSSAPYMLSYYVNKIFEDDNLAIEFSKNSREHSAQTHNRDKNIKKLLEIYQDIVSS